MGFRRIIQLRYAEGSGLEGLEVDLDPITVRQAQMVRTIAEGATPEEVNRRRIGILVGNPDAEHPADKEPAVRSWNLEQRDGTPLPLELDAVLDFDIAVLTRILTDWSEGCVIKDKGPLDKTSTDGSNTASNSVDEESIPTENLP